MPYGEVKRELIDYFNSTFNLEVTEKDCDTNLFLQPFSFRPYVLLYVYYSLEQRFNLVINTEMVLNGQFNTINNIANIIISSKERH